VVENVHQIVLEIVMAAECIGNDRQRLPLRDLSIFESSERREDDVGLTCLLSEPGLSELPSVSTYERTKIKLKIADLGFGMLTLTFSTNLIASTAMFTGSLGAAGSPCAFAG
jgi:hypothetical protein